KAIVPDCGFSVQAPSRAFDTRVLSVERTKGMMLLAHNTYSSAEQVSPQHTVLLYPPNSFERWWITIYHAQSMYDRARRSAPSADLEHACMIHNADFVDAGVSFCPSFSE
ncbi:unnamed protein product, partial [Scytosiphon promiscuus]